MAYLMNMAAFDRGTKLIDDMQSEKRQAMLDARQEERDQRDRDRYKRETDEYEGKKKATEGYLEEIRKAPDMTAPMSRLFGTPDRPQAAEPASPGPVVEGAQVMASPANPVQNNVVAAQPYGSFTGDPRQVQAAISGIKDPAERQRAMDAWRLQMNEPAKNAALLVAGREPAPLQQAAPAPARQVAPVNTDAVQPPAQPQAAQMVKMDDAVAPKPFMPPPEVMDRRKSLVAEAELVARINPAALPAVREKIQKFDLGVAAYGIRQQVMGMDEKKLGELIKRADVNPQFEVKAIADAGGNTVLTIGEKQVKLSKNQVADWMTGLFLMEQNDLAGGREMIASVNKELADASAKYMALQKDVRAANLDERKTQADELRAQSDADYKDRIAKTYENGQRGGGASGAKTGVVMDDVDKVLGPMFNDVDQITGVKKLNVPAYSLTRQLATQMPAALQGDAAGAALQAAQVYEAALAKAKGNHSKAAELIRQQVAAQSQPSQSSQTQSTEQPVQTANPTRPARPPSSPGMFTSPTGEIQLMQPLYNLNAYRRELQQQSQNQ